MAYIGVKATGLNTLSHWKARIWLPDVSKKFHIHPLKSAEAKPMAICRKVNLPPAKHTYAFSYSPLGKEFWQQIYSLWQALSWVLLSKILASMKMGGPKMLKGQFLKYLDQGTLGYHSPSRLPFECFSSPTNFPTHCSYLFTLNITTFDMLYELFLYLYFGSRGFLQSIMQQHQNDIWKGDMPSLFIPVATMRKCKQSNHSNL